MWIERAFLEECLCNPIILFGYENRKQKMFGRRKGGVPFNKSHTIHTIFEKKVYENVF